MSATARARRAMPVIGEVAAADGFKVQVHWREGARKGRVDAVDLSPLVGTFKLYRPLRSNRALFETVHVAEDGHAIAWGDGEPDMSATSIERLAEEAMTAEEFRAFVEANGLTHAQAAAVLGRSRRQIENYLAGEPIPRVVVLACYGYLARKLDMPVSIGA